MNVIIYDLTLLVIFLVFTSVFLYKKRANLKKDGLLFLYKTSRGIKIINNFAKKHKKLLDVLSYISIILGFVLMISVIYLFGKIVWLYIFHSEITKAIKIPPIMPLIPYLPQMFKITFLPPFYFVYWIIILAVVAISHEFSHGIFAANKKVKIKSTGFGFFPFFCPVFLAAFVELDEKAMEKKKVSHQMAILSAGTFANILTAIFFFAILALFFMLTFNPAGVIYDTYIFSPVPISSVISIDNSLVTNLTYLQTISLVNQTGKSIIKTNNKTYFLTQDFLNFQENREPFIFLYENTSAINADLSNTILMINGNAVTSIDELSSEIEKYSPGEKVYITGLEGEAFRDYPVVLGEDPSNNTKAYLGIGFIPKQSSGLIGKVMNFISAFRDQEIYYLPKFEVAEFIYNLLWWLVMISLSVALVNMIPAGIFDGGRFFYLAMLGITKNKTTSKKISKILTYIFLFFVLIIMIAWAIGLFK